MPAYSRYAAENKKANRHKKESKEDGFKRIKAVEPKRKIRLNPREVELYYDSDEYDS